VPVQLADHIEHLSATSLTQFYRCPQQWAYRRLHNLKEPPGSALLVGNGYHDALEANFLQKIVTMKDLPPKACEDAFHEAFEAEVEKAGGSGEIAWKVGEPRGDRGIEVLRQTGLGLTKVYRKQQAPYVLPFAVEEWFDIEPCGFPLTGRIDIEGELLNGDGPQHPPWKEADTCRACGAELDPPRVPRGLCAFCAGDKLIDHKTASQARIQPDAKIQVGVYQLHRPLPAELHVAVKTKTPKMLIEALPVAPAARTERWISNMIATIEDYMRRFGTGCSVCLSSSDCSVCGSTPWPGVGQRDSWACNYCGYGPKGTDRCPWWKEEPWRTSLF